MHALYSSHFATFLRRSSRKKGSSDLVAALALSDSILIVTQAPPLFLGALFSRYWAFGKLACQIYAYAGGVTGIKITLSRIGCVTICSCSPKGCTSIWLVIFIGYDLYCHLSKRAKKERGVTAGSAMGMILASFVYSLITNAPPFFGWGAFVPGQCGQ